MCCRPWPTHTQVALKGPSSRETTTKLISAPIDGHGCPCIGVTNLPSVVTMYSARGGALRFSKGSRNVKATLRQGRQGYALRKPDSRP